MTRGQYQRERRGWRRRRKAQPPPMPTVEQTPWRHEEPKAARGSRKPENAATIIAAAIATGVTATGMWGFFADYLHLPPYAQVGGFAFLEAAMVTSAARARRNVLEFGRAGVDGAAVWVIAGLIGVFSALDAGLGPAGLFRLITPLVSAWLWERGLSIERRRLRGEAGIHWRVTPERILVRLGLAEPTDRTVADVTADRWVSRVALAAARVRELSEAGARWRMPRARRRLRRTMARAVVHAQLASDPDRQGQMLARLGALNHAAGLARLEPAAPWDHAGTMITDHADKNREDHGRAHAPDFRTMITDHDPDRVRTMITDLGPVNGSDHGPNVVRPRSNGKPTWASVVTGPRSTTVVSARLRDEPTDPGTYPDHDHDSPDHDHGPRSDTYPDHDHEPIRTMITDHSRTMITDHGRNLPAEARAADDDYRAAHGRHISAERLAKALGIGKTRALALVREIRPCTPLPREGA